MLGRLAGQHDDTRADLNAAVKILDVFIKKADAARRYERADRRWLVGAMDSIECISKIESARAKRVAGPPRHHARQIWLAFDHLRRREPVRPFLHPGDTFGASPGKSFAADTDAVAHRLAVPERQI